LRQELYLIPSPFSTTTIRLRLWWSGGVLLTFDFFLLSLCPHLTKPPLHRSTIYGYIWKPANRPLPEAMKIVSPWHVFSYDSLLSPAWERTKVRGYYPLRKQGEHSPSS